MEENVMSNELIEDVAGGFGVQVDAFGVDQRYVRCSSCGQTVLVEPGAESCSNCGAKLT
ncbi:MAG: zinc ribbon domain-containing protein [Ruminococcus sp.]|jgi:hypothetical protein|nr:zinc ribbon domain-containing protein [Ruminococcus sp.]